MVTERWEDVIPVWHDPGYGDRAVPFDRSVRRRRVGGAIITLAEPVDWSGRGTRDLLLSAWDACYGARTRLFLHDGTEPDGTPRLAYTGEVEGVSGFVTAVADGERFHLLSTSRLRRSLDLYVNVGESGHPRFAAPLPLSLEADWLRQGEILHVARFVDIDGDGRQELVVGTDYWGDYWPEGQEWNVPGYRPYGVDGRWRGGPLRGNLYVFRNDGTPRAPRLGRGMPLAAGGFPVETYGQLGPAFGDFRGCGRLDLVCGSFLDELYLFPGTATGGFAIGRMLCDTRGKRLKLPHCINIPAAVDWNRDGRADLIVGSEDGRVWFLRNAGLLAGAEPAFHRPVPVCAADAPVQLGALPVVAFADWTGCGRDDLIAGNSAGELLFAPVHDGPALGRLVPVPAGGSAVRVEAGPSGSIQGPSEYRFGYTSPGPCHWFGTSRPDIVMGDILGRTLVLPNLGGSPPRFGTPCELACDGRPLRTVWRVRPAVADWTGSGHLQLVTLDAEGVLSACERISDVEVGRPRPLLYADGAPIRFTEDLGGGRGRIKLCLCDWNGHGCLDIIVGTHNRAALRSDAGGMPRHTTYQAGVFLLENVTGGDQPRFADARPFRYRGSPLALGMHECSPFAVRWRQRALPDLAVGVEDGSLLWFERETLSWQAPGA